MKTAKGNQSPTGEGSGRSGNVLTGLATWRQAAFLSVYTGPLEAQESEDDGTSGEDSPLDHVHLIKKAH
ncbi:MAG: hypothetical protein HKN47_14895 [Pirellulaceae bacterium]|nr:hypothetical protein [Pirellulaceae bacterium]